MHTSSAPRRASKSALEFGAGVDRLAVRDDHVLEGQLQQRAQRRQRSFLIRWRFPDAQLAARRCQRVGKNDGALLWQPQRRLVAAPTIVKCNDASRKLAARLDELQLGVGHVPAKEQARPESASVVAAHEQVDIANVSMANCYLPSHAFAGTTPSPNVHPCNMLQGRLVCHSFKSALSF